jgi:predicted AlkP superfamily pyrophosphatase or phosphodiesterase
MPAARRSLLSWTLALGLLAACERGGTTTTPEPAARPRLVVVLVVDQMRADYLTRFADLYKGGLDRLRRGGAVFTDAHIQHALTFTAPGHASVSTASHPNRHGIVSNEWYDRAAGRVVYAADDPQARPLATGERPPSKAGRSPANLLQPGLGDWLKEHVPQAKVFSVAFKDRSSVMLGGQHPDRAYWFDTAAAGYVSSSWYGEQMPKWVAEFNASGATFRRFSEGWQRLREPEAYARSGPDQVDAEHDGARSVFPHVFDDGSPQAREAFLKELQWTPFGDELTLAFAERMLREEQLGKDEFPDLLLVSCSSADYVGHRYGPMSHEAEDYYLRLDGWLEQLLATLDKEVGAGNYVLAMTADHGAIPLVEELAKSGQKAARRVVLDEFGARAKTVARAAVLALGLPETVVLHVAEEGVWLDTAAAEAKGVPAAKLRAAVAEQLRTLDFVAETFTADALAATGSADTPYLTLYRRSYRPERSPDVMLRVKEWTVVHEPTGTSHGSPYRYDTHVPVLFFGGRVSPKSIDRPVGTVDVAPTLAEFLGLSAPSGVDGRSLAAAVTSR